MTGADEIFVGLVGEGIDVWRPVHAEHLHDNIYRITDQPYDRAVETWEFEPGDEVACELIASSGGRILAATSRHRV